MFPCLVIVMYSTCKLDVQQQAAALTDSALHACACFAHARFLLYFCVAIKSSLIVVGYSSSHRQSRYKPINRNMQIMPA